jgi:oxygen-independent coproporphyrinogen-3 oxidase
MAPNASTGPASSPEVDREFIEVYPLAWRPLGDGDVQSILSQRSFDGIDEITLYAHIPFCPELCAFCGFNKTSFRQEAYERYIGKLLQEITYYRDHPDLEGRRVSAIYIGGGTGSTLTPADLDRLIDAMASVFPLEERCELTVESHPATLSAEKLTSYAASGVNRLSIGTQSFSDRKLRALRRHHTSADNLRVLGEARAAGIENVSIDLLYRVPYETLGELESDLHTIIGQSPTNVACYSLIVEGTNFARTLASLPDRELEDEMRALVASKLTGAGYERWSLNDFCKPGGMTTYNVNYWAAPQTLLLGLGCGSHTHYFGGHIWTNTYSVDDYMATIEAARFPGTIGQAVTVEELMHRSLVMGLHCLDVDMAAFERVFGVSGWDKFAAPIADLASRGWVERAGDRLRVTTAGHPYLFNISKAFFSDASRGEGQPWARGLQKLKTEHTVMLPISPVR